MKGLFGKLFGSGDDEKTVDKADLLGRPFRSLINRSGKVSYADLAKRAAILSEKEFVSYVDVPVLVGSAIQSGIISEQKSEVKRKKTMVFMPTLGSERAQAMAADALKHAVYPLVKGQHTSNEKTNIFLIGRLSDSDIVMPDFAISERHATISAERGQYLVKELGSTNGTTVNGVEVEKGSAVPLKEGDVLGLARYEFTFLSPAGLFLKLRNIEVE